MKKESPCLYILAGPTGVGKTSLAFSLASRRDMEIISADSMQIYRQLSIGTAKPSPQEMNGAACHLIDMVDIDQKYDLSRFIRDADEVIALLHRKQKRPLVVGGAGLYIKGLLEGVFETESVNRNFREELHSRIEAGELPQLYSELMRIDPVAASRIKPGDRQRIVRALEVYLTTGTPISVHQEMSRRKTARYSHCMVVITRERKEIYQRIEQRVDEMFASGFVGEVEGILKSGFSKNLHPLKALGYREAICFLEGTWSLERAKEEMKKATRRYAKRQITWFKAMPQAIWLNISGMDQDDALSKIEEIFFGVS
ncbi:tRNA (adenosine(37)-N6)-dimethylallyltransferase MiaA [Candidatus Sumerlaeota bacterium]|nr:tRNA (adenosine(37)-N6)-dimethylallyltransferase MiaA [Candidatus Sumerlaeota bacterium]